MNKFLTLVVGFLLLGLTAFSQILQPVKWSFNQKEISTNVFELQFNATIDNGWHLYSNTLKGDDGPSPTKISFEQTDKFEIITPFKAERKPIKVYDKAFKMDVEYFSNNIIFTVKVKVKSADNVTIKGAVEFMSCNDESCTPPTESDFEFNLKSTLQNSNHSSEVVNQTSVVKSNESSDSSSVVTENNNQNSNGAKVDSNDAVPPANSDLIKNADDVSDETSRSLWTFLLISFLAGLAAILTPCVFPMIPMTVTFFMHSDKSKLRARMNAIMYGISIVAIYTVIGTIVALVFGPAFANWLSTNWIPNVLFFAVFVFFAFSFFGMFEIILPSWIVNKADKNSDKGGFMGSFFMALTLVLVSFSCTGPIVGAILVESAGGQILKPIVGMFGFSLAFALPFTLFAIFPQWLSNLPKSGGWLNSVKVVLGFIELALGLKFLSIADQTYHWGILDREVYIAIWIVIFVLMGFYLLGKIKFAHDSDVKHVSVPRLMLSIVTFSFVVYLIPGMFGAPLKAISGYLPPMSTHDFDLHKIIREEVSLVTQSEQFSRSSNNTESLCEKPKYSEFLELPHGLSGFFDYEQALACAKATGKPIFIDFTGHGCVNCREMEANVWGDARVLKRLKNDFIVVALYVDDKSKLPESEWVTSKFDGKVKKTLGAKYADFQIERFKVNAQPYYVIFDHNETMLTKPTARDLNPDNFVDFLDKGISEFKKRHTELK